MSDDDEFGDFDIELNEDTLKALQDTEDRYSLTTASQAYAPQQPAVSSPAAPKPAVASLSSLVSGNGNTGSIPGDSHASSRSSTPGVNHAALTSTRGSTTITTKPLNAPGPSSRGGFVSRANQPSNPTQMARTAPPLGGFIRGSQRPPPNNKMEVDPVNSTNGPSRSSVIRASQSFNHGQPSNPEADRLRAQIREVCGHV